MDGKLFIMHEKQCRKKTERGNVWLQNTRHEYDCCPLNQLLNLQIQVQIAVQKLKWPKTWIGWFLPASLALWTLQIRFQPCKPEMLSAIKSFAWKEFLRCLFKRMRITVFFFHCLYLSKWWFRTSIDFDFSCIFQQLQVMPC